MNKKRSVKKKKTKKGKTRRKTRKKTSSAVTQAKRSGTNGREKKTRLLSQKYKSDCVVACLSMMTKIPHATLINKYFKDHDFTKKGLKWSTENKIMKLEGITPVNMSTKKLPNSKAILTVLSLNYPKTYHAIMWDPNTSRKVFDPNINHHNKDKKIKVYTIPLLKKSELFRVVGISRSSPS